MIRILFYAFFNTKHKIINFLLFLIVIFFTIVFAMSIIAQSLTFSYKKYLLNEFTYPFGNINVQLFRQNKKINFNIKHFYFAKKKLYLAIIVGNRYIKRYFTIIIYNKNNAINHSAYNIIKNKEFYLKYLDQKIKIKTNIKTY